MTIHVSLVSKNIVNVFVGTKEEAQADGAELIEPTTDEVTYSDGTTDEVYGFDIPVEKLDEDFNVAIIGKKGTWYDHVVSVSIRYRRSNPGRKQKISTEGEPFCTVCPQKLWTERGKTVPFVDIFSYFSGNSLRNRKRMKGPQYMSCQKKATGKFKNVVWSQTATNSFPAFLNSSVAIKLIIGHIIAIIIMEIASVITIGRSCGVTMQKANL